MSGTATSERAFESLIEDHLLSHGGYTHGVNAQWSQELALDPPTLFAFLQETQPQAWERLANIHGATVEAKLLTRIVKELDNRGTLDLLRDGVVDYGVRFHLAFFKPASGLNPETQRLYDLNQWKIYRQLHHSQKNPSDSVDLVLGLNGLPIATLELKNAFTGQTSADAKHQFMQDRDPREPLFAFKRRCLVHFAVDTDQVWMTTRLNGRDTRFLPFNKGDHEGAGNPPNPLGHRTAYLWEDILAKNSLLDILGRFAHLQQEELTFNGRTAKRESMIFPRYHQLDVVRRLEHKVQQVGSGENYLIQHSAGSGKSNSIAWLAYGLSNLHNDQNTTVFDCVIVITDRRVLDRQLQDTIYQFEHTRGVVEKIDQNSEQLARALENGARIIVTTLQKFPFVVDQIGELPQRRYAVIIDEAHSSQTGEAADKVKEVLTGAYLDNGLDAEDVIARKMEARRAQQPNLSFFAFTATPKPKTLAAFGTLGSDGLPHAWHVYSMRQAIEEGFILDVLKGYTTYDLFFRLTKRIEDDPRLDKKQAARAIARFLSLHPHNVAQKVAIIVEHFRTVVKEKIGGQAKAMVVTGSRREAVAYKVEMDEYLREKSYTDIKALVAFSGTVKDEYDQEFTEPDMNGFGERELPERFATDEYQLLLVADKYQTGFDQPLLHTMYVDKKLAGVRAVQTLSRLNRTYPGKDDTFVLDFANTPDEIREAFQPFYEATSIEENPDPNQLYDLFGKLDPFGVTQSQEVEAFASVFFAPRRMRSVQDHARLNSLIDPAVARAQRLTTEQQDEYKHLLAAFLRLYGFLSQIMPFTDKDLEKFYAYGRLLAPKLRDEDRSSRFQFGDEVALEYYRLQKISEGTITLMSEGGALSVPTEVGTGGMEHEEAPLSTIVQEINKRSGTSFTPADQLFFEQIEQDLIADQELAKQAKQNSLTNFKYPFDDVFMGKVIERMEQNQDITDKIMNEERFADVVRQVLLDKVYWQLQKPD
jgi:type I restriction enzyme R subunit